MFTSGDTQTITFPLQVLSGWQKRIGKGTKKSGWCWIPEEALSSVKGTREIRANLISIPLRVCDSCFWRHFRLLRTSPCVLLNLVCSPIVISCKTLYKTSKGFLGLSRYRWGCGGKYIAVFCLAVGPRENLSQRISFGGRGGEEGGQHLGPIEKKV